MGVLDRIEADRQAYVLGRLQQNLIAWFTTVRGDGQPECIPVWFLWREDESILVYSQPTARKLESIGLNPKVALALDVSDLGRDLVRIHGVANISTSEPPAHENEPYVAKYMERIGALFGTPAYFAELFSVPLVVTPKRVFA